MGDLVQFGPRLYEAKMFKAQTACGEFVASGTLCGAIDFHGPGTKVTWSLSPGEVQVLIAMLQSARTDVLESSDPNGDPRIVG